MIKLYINDTDRTTYLQKDSIMVDETITTDNNTCSFVLEDLDVTEGQDVKIYSGQVTSAAITASGSPQAITFQHTSNNLDYINQFRVGEYILAGLGSISEEECLITAVSTSSVTAIFTNSHSAGVFIAKKQKVFAGTIERVGKVPVTPMLDYNEHRVALGSVPPRTYT